MNQTTYTIETEHERGTKEFDNEVFGAMRNMIQDLTKDFYKKPKVEHFVSHSNGSTWRVIRKETLNPRGHHTRQILCYKKTKEQAEKYCKECQDSLQLTAIKREEKKDA